MEVVVKDEAFTEDQLQAIQDFKKNGCPGLSKINDVKVFKWFELYMTGKGFSEIAEASGDKHDLIMYMAYRLKWHERRMEYYKDMVVTMADKLAKTKIETIDTVSTMVMSLNKYYKNKFNKFLMSGDTEIIEVLDTKLLTQYYKSIESLQKLLNPNQGKSDDQQSPIVNININKDQSERVDINQQSVSELLKQLSLEKDESEKN
jgi:hypothetical protein